MLAAKGAGPNRNWYEKGREAAAQQGCGRLLPIHPSQLLQLLPLFNSSRSSASFRCFSSAALAALLLAGDIEGGAAEFLARRQARAAAGKDGAPGDGA